MPIEAARGNRSAPPLRPAPSLARRANGGPFACSDTLARRASEAPLTLGGPILKTLADARVALVHDWLTGFRGGEKCLEVLCRLFPTAPIYTLLHVRGSLPEVIESLVVGQQRDHDERIVLFVRLRDGVELTDELRDRIRRQVRERTTPRHVPARIVQVPEIPRTKSGKIVELAVRDVIHGREVKNREALANPDALEYFRDRVDLKD